MYYFVFYLFGVATRKQTLKQEDPEYRRFV